MPARRERPLLTLFLTVLVVFASLGLGRFGFSMVLPAMQEAMQLTNTEVGQLQSWNLFGYLVFVVVAGILATRFGPSVVIMAALAVIGIAMLATGAANSFAAVAVGRLFAGVGAAAANVPAIALLAAWFSGRRRGLASGCAVAGSSLGMAATGAGVPVLLERFGAAGWRYCWYTFGATALAICALCCLLLRDHPKAVSRPAPGSAGRQTNAGVLRSGMLWRLAGAYFAFGFSYSIYATFLVKHLVRGFGMTTADAGAIWMRIGLLSIVSGFIWGAMSDLWGRRAALIAIFVCQATSFLVVGLIGGRSAVTVSGLLFALTAWSIPAVVGALCGDVFGARLAPTALGVVTVVFGVGQVLGPLVAGRVADATGSFSPAFTIGGVVALLMGAGISLLLPPGVIHAPTSRV